MSNALLICVVALCAMSWPITAQLVWQKISAGGDDGPSPRRDMGLGYDAAGNGVLVFGGREVVNDEERVLSDLWIYDITTDSWRQVPPSSPWPPARFSFVAGVSHDYFYVSTGQGPNQVFYEDIWRLDIRSETWEQLPTQTKPSYYTAEQWAVHQREAVIPGFRQGAVGGLYPNSSRVYLSLGASDHTHPDTYSYNLNDRGWYLESPGAGLYNPRDPHGRDQHAGTMISADEILIYGGCLSGRHSGGACPASDSWIYDGKKKEWTPLEGCASARTFSTLAMLPSVYGERRAVLYGGEENGGQVLTTVVAPANQVAILNPDNKSWTLRKTDGDVPSKRASVGMTTGPDGIFMFGGYEIEGGSHQSDLYLLMGSAFSADRAPKQAECRPTFFSLIMLHGILMALGWGFFLQWGAFIAKYAKYTTPIWLNLHKLFQIFGLLVTVAGFIAGVVSVRSGHFQFVHAQLGLVVMILGLLQPLNTLCRASPSQDRSEKSVRRAVWQFFHRNLGRATLLLAVINISLGVFMAASHQIIWAAWYSYLVILIASYLIAEFIQSCRRKDNWAKYLDSEKSGSQKYLVNHDSTDFIPHFTNSPRAGSSGIGDDRSYSRYAYENPAMSH